MGKSGFLILSSIFIIVHGNNCHNEEKRGKTNQLILGDLNVEITNTEVEIQLKHLSDDRISLRGQLGLHLPPELGEASPCLDSPLCWSWGNVAKLEISQTSDHVCYDIKWSSEILKSFEDCFDLDDEHFWFVGPEEYEQHFPIRHENQRRPVPYVPGDMLQDREEYFGGVTEPYWLSSEGVALWLLGNDASQGQPLFFSWNHQNNKKMCGQVKNVPPYSVTSDDPISLTYKICSAGDAKAMHLYAVKNLLGLPESIPDEVMFTSPIWSTWAQYKANINESVVLDFADNIRLNGFSASQVEIDDNWESCYGDATFNNERFSNAADMVQRLKDEYGFRVTLWIHPFINLQCSSWYFAGSIENSFLVRDTKGKEGYGRLPGLMWWWQGELAGYIDFTNEKAVDWWSARLEALRDNFGIDSFKFDAGEVNWMPSSLLLNQNISKTLWPAAQTTKYVEAVAQFGRQIEVRVGYRSQRHPIFVRMLDKDSRWGYDNGLKTLITTMLQISMSGYPFVLPDMIGGNGYSVDDPLEESAAPPRELFIRWLQANTFMPAMQFSFVPWAYDKEVVALAKRFVDLHETYAPIVIALAREAVTTGTPINRPIWWLDPNDKQALACDSEFLLGDSVLVAPVLDEGATSRDIYLPKGHWIDENLEGVEYDGPILLKDYSAPIDVLPYFTRM